MRRWHAERQQKVVALTEYVEGASSTISPEESLKVSSHSPDGFEFGYGGSGPAQLALAIMLRYFRGDVRQATTYYQDFKWAYVASAQGECFGVTEMQIERWLTMVKAVSGGRSTP